jgi:coenzyme F420-reducing hydrogenase gamma subunit
MYEHLETAQNRDSLKRVVVDPVSRVEGHGKVTLLLDKVRPIHEVVKIDYFLPGCPPSADVFWKFLTDLIDGHQTSLPYELVHYD